MIESVHRLISATTQITQYIFHNYYECHFDCLLDNTDKQIQIALLFGRVSQILLSTVNYHWFLIMI